MKIKSLKLRNFRNLESCFIQFDSKINVLLGKNAQGKTNILESLVFLSTSRSHRTGKDQDMIRDEQPFSNLECIIDEAGKKTLAAVIHDKGKTLIVQKQPVSRSSEYIGILNVILFSPSDLEIFESSPKFRRRMMDIEIGKVQSMIMSDLNNYSKLLKDRNNVLKYPNPDKTYLHVLEDQMIECQITIQKAREEFLAIVNQGITAIYQKLSGESNMIYLEYIKSIETGSAEMMRNQWKEKYAKNLERDLILKATTSGIHRDDFLFYINDKEVSSYASQGQRRMILLSLKLMLIDYIYQKKKIRPVLLLDDVLSELDQQKRVNLFHLIPEDIQTLITTTDIEDFVDLLKEKPLIYEVDKGLVSLWKEEFRYGRKG